jgi:hypothetical protein
MNRIVILPESRVPNLASRVMKPNLATLSQDWLRIYGHEVLVAESFADVLQSQRLDVAWGRPKAMGEAGSLVGSQPHGVCHQF